ncbi:MAG: radical SAM family heme chaperone HemW [Bacteroidetes bacterium]|nr:radical SAM family heme chaperone HemW [Bacteroidota bacterium]
MSGIYLHIPYCKQKCHYCNFYSLASEKHREDIVPSIVREMELQKEYLQGEVVNTVYFGGGTPALLTASEISILLDSIYKHFMVANDAEITLEANPDDLSLVKLKAFRSAGINRLSIGVQSFEEEDLEFLNRTHSARQAISAIKQSKTAGFVNLSIDLIYGIPNQDIESWESNLMTAIELGVPHLSAYALTVEEKTPMAVMIRKGNMPNVDDALQAQHFRILTDLLEAHGYLHYEISNFCKPGKFSKHNTSYWKGVSYLGLGPSAHSYNGNSRQWNVSNLGQYVQSIRKDIIPFEKEILSQSQQFNEYVMTSLRTQWGCDLQYIEKHFGKSWAEQAKKDIEKYIKENLLILSEDVLYLSKSGKFRADGIAAEMFRVG